VASRKTRAALSRSKGSEDAELVEFLRSNGNLSEWFAVQTAKLARSGNTDAARDILKDFVGAIDERSEKMWPGLGPPIHWAYARYLADAFKSILDGKDAALALGVKSSKAGRRAGKATHNLEALAAAYWFLVRRGLNPERANLELHERTGADRRTIQRAATTGGHKAFKYSQLIDDEVLKTVFKPYAAAIEQILAAASRRHKS
jgi:hypothetical protein